MKKLLMLIPAILALTACGGEAPTSSTDVTSGGQSTSVIPSSSGAVGPEIHDITISLEVSGIEEYVAGKWDTIWMNSDMIPAEEAGKWGIEDLVQSEGDDNKWSMTIEDVELGQIYYYNFYYGSASNPDWTGKNTEAPGDDESRYFETTEGVYEYNLVATFETPDDYLDVTITIVPTLMTDKETTVEMEDTVCVWAWTSTDGNVRFEKQLDGSWSYVFSVPLVNGIGKFEFTATLGDEYVANFDYQYGEWNSDGTWKEWETSWKINDFERDVKESATAECTFNVEAGQPVTTGVPLFVTFVESIGDEFTDELGNRWVDYDATHSALADIGTWSNNLASGDEGYTGVGTYDVNEFYLCISIWDVTLNQTIKVGTTTENGFHVVLEGDNAAYVTISVTLGESVGSFAGEVISTGGCLVE